MMSNFHIYSKIVLKDKKIHSPLSCLKVFAPGLKLISNLEEKPHLAVAGSGSGSDAHV